MANDPLV